MNTRFDNGAGHQRLREKRSFAWMIAVRLALLSVLVLPGTLWTASPTRAKEIVVPTDHSTIQAAVDAARPGDTIKVKHGTYLGQITVNKNLTLKGAGEETTLIRAPAMMMSYGDNLRGGLQPATIVKITDGVTVEMSDFTVSGPIQCGLAASGIAVIKNATLKITKSRVTRMHTEGSCAPENLWGQGIIVGLPSFILVQGETNGGSIGHATITELVIDDYQYDGIRLDAASSGSPSTATIADNLIIAGEEIPGEGGQYGISLGWVIAQIIGNKIHGNACTGSGCGPDPINDFQSAGITAPFFPTSATEIAGNDVSNNDVGIYEYIGDGKIGYVIRGNVLRTIGCSGS